MDLLSVVLNLKPLPYTKPAEEMPAWWGRAAHALLLNIVRQADPTLAQTLHDEHSLRPFTVSTLMGHFLKGAPDPQALYMLRLTAVNASLAQILLNATQSGGPLAPGKVVELDYLPFAVESLYTRPEEHPWAAATTYADLAAARLVAADPPPRLVTLQLTSPTTFKSQDKHQPLPLPELVFSSLLERWNSFAPLAFPPELRRYAAECLAVSRFELQSRPVLLKNSGLRVGAVGQITYTTLNYDRYWMSLVHTLAAYALFAGVGAGASSGLGQCRQVA